MAADIDTQVAVVVVTDPMCSWCWGMAEAVDMARSRLAQQGCTFDLWLGGINIDSVNPVGDYGRRLMFKLWSEVEATTGAPFGYRLPARYVHNSRRACYLIHALRNRADVFAVTHRLMHAFFVEGLDIGAEDVLVDIGAHFGCAADDVRGALTAPDVQAGVEAQFARAGGYGTQALPSVLLRRSGQVQLLAGGYLDADMLCELVNERLRQRTAQ